MNEHTFGVLTAIHLEAGVGGSCIIIRHDSDGLISLPLASNNFAGDLLHLLGEQVAVTLRDGVVVRVSLQSEPSGGME